MAQATITLTLQVAPQLQIITGSLPGATQGSPYSVQLNATGGQAPYTWTATGLPAGLTCSTTGLISGTPTVNGTFSATITVTDSGP